MTNKGEPVLTAEQLKRMLLQAHTEDKADAAEAMSDEELERRVKAAGITEEDRRKSLEGQRARPTVSSHRSASRTCAKSSERFRTIASTCASMDRRSVTSTPNWVVSSSRRSKSAEAYPAPRCGAWPCSSVFVAGAGWPT
jgi:hypothetical protein